MSAMDRAERRAFSSFTLHHVPADFQSEIVPPYNTSVFAIEDFSRMRNNADPIYSPPLVVDGLKWRLKVKFLSNSCANLLDLITILQRFILTEMVLFVVTTCQFFSN